MTILIVDDTADIRELLSVHLSRKGIPCSTTGSALEALELMKNNSYDVIFLDLGIPEFRGFDALRALTYGGILDDKNVYIITAKEISSKQEKMMMTAGVRGVLRKPFSLKDIDAIIKDHCDGKNAS
jgi:DNA-binding response OmpR family regulator